MNALTPNWVFRDFPTWHQILSTPWLARGRSVEGADCVGLVLLYAAHRGLKLPDVPTPPDEDRDQITADIAPLLDPFPAEWQGLADHVVIFANESGRYVHLGVITAEGKLFHHTAYGPRCDNSPELLRRVGLRPAGVVPLRDAERLARVLAHPGLAWVAVLLIIVSLVASYLLMPKLGNINPGPGRYGYNGLITQNSSQIPVPDILGQVWTAGNLVYQEVMDQTAAATSEATQRACHVVVLAAGPIADFGYATYDLRVNGLSLDDPFWFSDGTYSGFVINPTQLYPDCMLGNESSLAHLWTNRPSVTFYDGSARPNVPLDVRAICLRDAPLYGFNGCASVWFRMIDSRKFAQFNLQARLKGRIARTFTSAGFDRASVSAESLAGADGAKTQFVLVNTDIEAVTSLTVNGTAYTLMDAAHQSGNVYWLNKTRGYVEFPTAPAAAATILCDYGYFPRAWTNNPASHVIYLLTELGFGKGLAEGILNWASFVTAATWYADTVTTVTSAGTFTGPRFITNYAVDTRSSLLDHLKAVLDACQSSLVVANGQIYLRPRMTDSSVFSFTADNILAGTFSASKPDLVTVPNQIALTFHDYQSFSAESAIVVDDPDAQDALLGRTGVDGVVPQALKFPAIDSVAQATRVAQQLLAEFTAEWACQFTTTTKGLGLQPGDVVDVTHPAQPTWAGRLMRIIELTYDADERQVLKLQDYVAPPA